MKKTLEFLVYSNIYLSIGASIVALATIILMGHEIVWSLLFIPFSATLLIYNFNRLTDSHEDIINIPERANFIRKFGWKMLYFSVFLYAISLLLAYQRNIYTLIIAIIPVVCASFYSYFRFKKFFIIKNILVSISWGFSVLLVGTFFESFNIFLLLIYFFFMLQFLINVIIFDVKDLKGDSLYKIGTLPVNLGVEKTRKVCFVVLILLFIIWFFIISIDIKGLILLPFLIYVGLFVKNAEKYEKRPWWYYGVFVDGEFFILLLLILVWLAFVGI